MEYMNNYMHDYSGGDWLSRSWKPVNIKVKKNSAAVHVRAPQFKDTSLKKGCLAKSKLYTVCFYKQSLIATAPHTVHVQGKL